MSQVGSVERDAYAVLFPAFDAAHVPDWLSDSLDAGTVAVIVGESRPEYVSREMSSSRRARETAQSLGELNRSLEEHTRGPVLIAVDQEPWGIQRLHDLVPPFPAVDELVTMADPDIESSARAVAGSARKMGFNAFLSPVLDRLDGGNPWLAGRTLDLPHTEISRIAAAFARGVHAAGVIAVAKHFPGFPVLDKDPALEDTAVDAVHWSDEALEPFARVIATGVRAVMAGPALVEALDAEEPASTSPSVIDVLRRDLGFAGVVVSDDLDAPATTRGRSLEDTAVASVSAGADLLLLSGGRHVAEVAAALASAASADPRLGGRLSEAAGRVRDLVNTIRA